MIGVDVVIPNYNGGAAMVAECLEAVFAQGHADLGVTVVDNGSAAESLAAFERYRGRLALIQMGENTGFGRAVNAGIRATARSAVLLLNNDVVLAPGAVAALADALAESAAHGGEIGGVNALLLRYGDRGIVDSAGIGFSPRWQHEDLLSGGPAGAAAQDREIAGLCAGAALYDRRFLEDVGLFDEAMFLVFEDVDLSLRGLWRGWRYRLASRAACYHRRGATTAALQAPRNRGFDRVKASSKYNHLRYVAKNLPLRSALWKLAYMAQKDLAGKLSRGCPSTRAAYRRFFRDVPEVLAARRRIMATRRIDAATFRRRALGTGP